MPNDYFQFKQFTIQQNKSAMKVCTDACILGAFAAKVIQQTTSNIQLQTSNFKLLDIGTGTGLLSLMIAQETNCTIHAVEIDNPAAEQATENITASSWPDRVKIFHASIQDFVFSKEKIKGNIQPEYKYIISNPPFFNNSLSGNNIQKNVAKHTAALSYPEIASAIDQLLLADGFAFIMLPFEEMQLFKQQMARKDFYPHHIFNIRQTEKHGFFRSIVMFSKGKIQDIEQQELTIKINDTYSDDFIGLLKEYYLYL